jgi:exopolysaccharide biosynthesis polyprenyl glycosylphosphotransferase
VLSRASGQLDETGLPGVLSGGLLRFASRAAFVTQAGYALAVFIPLFVAGLVVEHQDVGTSLLVATLLGGIWFGCLRLGFAESRTTLATLGGVVAAVRGTLLGLVAATVAGVWSETLRFDVATLLVVAAVILVLSASWETYVERHLTPPLGVLLVGPRDGCSAVLADLRREAPGRFVVIGVVDDADDRRDPLVVGHVDELPAIVALGRPDLVALVPGCDRPAAFAGLLDSAANGFRVLELAQFYEFAFGRVPVADLTRAWFMSVLHLYQRPYSRLAKRTTDVVGVLLLLVLTLPLFPLMALMVWFTPGPILIRQVRVGEHGRLFTMFKFRTMRAGAERPGQAVWAATDDPRVTTAGRVMRRVRLDELPQIWNVLKGEMSLVGPRPERPEFIDDLLDSVPFWTRRHLVKPGITGWAQVNRGYTADAAGTLDKLSYDLWYIRHRSLTVDLVICARTVKTALFGDPFSARRREDGTAFDPIPTLLYPPPPALLDRDGLTFGSSSS